MRESDPTPIEDEIHAPYLTDRDRSQVTCPCHFANSALNASGAVLQVQGAAPVSNPTGMLNEKINLRWFSIAES